MQLDDNPFFRKPITSWYDSNFICRTVMVVMAFALIFAIAGIIVGFGTEEFQEYVWFPALLSFLSFFVLVKIALRLRYRSKNG
jgi:hypothetical protein